MRKAKNTMMVVAGICWVVFAVAIGMFLYRFLVTGAGLQSFVFFGFGVSPLNVLLGLAQFVGFAAAAVLCFVVGFGLCIHGLVPVRPAPEAEPVDASKYQS
jgi:hypothetical protein